MKQHLDKDLSELIESPHYLPSISILMPFEPKMSAKHELQKQMKYMFNSVKKQLINAYSFDSVQQILVSVQQIVDQLDYTTHKKSVCIFVSAVMEKVIYLAFPVEQKIIIDESFQVRDIVYNRKMEKRFLLLLLGGKGTRLYLGDNEKLIRVVCDLPLDIDELESDLPEQVSNFSDVSAHKENLLHKFIMKVDNSLSLMLKAYPLPLFVTGTDRMLGHFRSLSHNTKGVLAFIPISFMETSEAALLPAIRPYLQNWEKVKQEDILKQLEIATASGRLVKGIQNVWKASTRKNNRLLIVEKSFCYPADRISNDIIVPHSGNSEFYIKDAVDDVIENVLRNGGDVAFAEDNSLLLYDKIALIRYYSHGD